MDFDNRSIKLLAAKFSLILVAGLLASGSQATEGVMVIDSAGIRTLTEDHAGTIVIESDYVHLDCNGHTISNSNQRAVCDRNGTSTRCGIEVRGRYVDINNCPVTGHPLGISLKADGARVYNSTIAGNQEGIYSNFVYSSRIFNTIIALNNEGASIRNNTSLQFYNNLVFFNARDGLDINDSYDVAIANNLIAANGDHNVEVDDSSYIFVAGNRFSGVGSTSDIAVQTERDNLQLENVYAIEVHNNVSDDSGRHGIYIRNVTTGSVTGNSSTGNAGSDCWNRTSTGVSYRNNSFGSQRGCN